ncbi:uncharacterized protein LOC122857590 [Aphidius gifuensis]|uniref:uncharacterized protein LOC122857590 n=1 Tax=Aphidius gifuensis TaxID=684658 RepID=UPI001CDC735B|nr:uncharacterized protein LOC122857590 [Aphidius gifuensis]
MFRRDEKAETISTLIENVLDQHSLLNKLVAFSGDNTNTNFGGRKRGGQNNIFCLLKNKINTNLVGVGCPAHVLHNAIEHALGQFGLYDIDSIVLKIHNYFKIYTVRISELQEFCEFVDITFRDLLYHSKTRWLSLMPCVHRMLQMFPALKSYFLSQDEPPKILAKFFEDDISECYLFFVHSIMSVFHNKTAQIEKEKNSILEVKDIINEVINLMAARSQEGFVPVGCKKILKQLRENGQEKMCDNFEKKMIETYRAAENYLKQWTDQFNEFEVFEWINLKKDTELVYNQVSDTMLYLENKNISIVEDKLFDQFLNLKNFWKSKENNDEFFKQSCEKKIVDFLVSNTCEESCSEIIKITEYFFAIPGHNANCERVFSMINAQWTSERNKFLVKNIKHLITVLYNFKNYSCMDFCKYLKEADNENILKKISSAQKYETEKI